MTREQYLPRTEALFTEFIANPPTPREILEKFNTLEAELVKSRSEVEEQEKLIELMKEALEWSFREVKSTHCERLVKGALATLATKEAAQRWK